MPILRIPVDHKFGILSQGQARKLFKEAVEAEKLKLRAEKHAHVQGPNKVDWDFVEKYAVADGTARKKMEAFGQKCLQRIQYRLNSHKDAPKSPPSKSFSLLEMPLDLSDSWYEIVFLCQCEGSIQTDALAVLAASLDTAPVSPAHIPCLLYIATLGYRWLKSDDISEEFLRSGEVVVLRLIYLVSLRLFCHLVTGSLKDLLSTQEGEYFKTDFDGFHLREQLYESFPLSHYYWRIVLCVGEMICHMISGDTVPSWAESISSAKHSLPTFLWHSLDLLRAHHDSQAQLAASALNFLKCSPQPHKEQVVEGVLALGILFQVSQGSADVLSVLQVIAVGLDEVAQGSHCQPANQLRTTSPNSDPLPIDEGFQNSSRNLYNGGHVNVLGQQAYFKTSAGTSYTVCSGSTKFSEEKGDSYRTLSPSGTQGDSVDVTTSVSDRYEQQSTSGKRRRPSDPISKIVPPSHQSEQQEDLMSSIRDLNFGKHVGYRKSVSISLAEQCTEGTFQYAVSEAPLEDGAAFLGSVAPSTLFHRSPMSTPNTLLDYTMFDGGEDDENVCCKFEDYPWELTVAYCLGMTSVIINGRSSKIQAQALEGYVLPDLSSQVGKKGSLVPVQERKKVFGLTDLAQFNSKLRMEQYDVSWRVRYAAVRGLSAVCHICKTQVVKDGFSDVAWERIIQLHSKEKHRKVLDAFKLPPTQRKAMEMDGQYNLSIFSILGNFLIKNFFPAPSPAMSPVQEPFRISSSIPSNARTSSKTLSLSPTAVDAAQQKDKPNRAPKIKETGVPTVSPLSRQHTKAKVNSRWSGCLQKPQSQSSANLSALNTIAEAHWQHWLAQQEEEEGIKEEQEGQLEAGANTDLIL